MIRNFRARYLIGPQITKQTGESMTLLPVIKLVWWAIAHRKIMTQVDCSKCMHQFRYLNFTCLTKETVIIFDILQNVNKTFLRTQSTVFLKEKSFLYYPMSNTVAPVQEHLEGGLRLSSSLEKSAIPERYSWHSPLCKQINTDFLAPDPVGQCYPRKNALGSFWNVGLKPFRLTQEAFKDENFLRTALISTLFSSIFFYSSKNTWDSSNLKSFQKTPKPVE